MIDTGRKAQEALLTDFFLICTGARGRIVVGDLLGEFVGWHKSRTTGTVPVGTDSQINTG